MSLRRASVLLVAVLTTGCAVAAPQALSPQLEEHQRLANLLHRGVRVHGGWAPEDYLGVVQTAPVWKSGFGGLDMWLRGDIVGTQCGQYVIASLLALREHPSADQKTVNEEAVKRLVSVGWSAQAAEAARASCPATPVSGNRNERRDKVSDGEMVTPAGFEPAISTLKGSRPRPG